MKLLLKLILNRFVLSILILFMFAMDFKLIRFNPVEIYTVTRPPDTSVANEYYVIEFGETDIYVEVTYLDSKIYLVPKSELPTAVLKQPVISWYYYALGLAIVNMIPFGFFTKTKKVKKSKK